MPLAIGAQGVNSGLRGQATNEIALAAGASYVIPAGSWFVKAGKYATVQQYDPIMGIWVAIGSDMGAGGGQSASSMRYVNSDGVNFRVSNQTGCCIGALITNAGSGYTSAPTCTASGGSAVFSCIVGGAINTSVTVVSGGTNYTYPPIVVIEAPPAGGIPATATCTISSGAVNAVTVTNQGAGYASAPAIFFKNDPRDSTGAGASATSVLTGAGTVTGILVTDHGTAVTSIPTLSFSGGGGSSAAATAIMCWTITAYTVVTAGSGYLGATEITGLGGFPATAAAYTNPSTQSQLLRTRKASIQGALSGVAITATGQIVDDGGIYPGVPTAMIVTSPIATLTTAAGINFTVGGASTTFELWAA